MTAVPNVTSLQTVLAGLATGGAKRIQGTKHSGPLGIESIIEYRSKFPVYLNVIDWADTFIVVSINGLDSADLRSSAQPNPGEIGETPNDALWGGRTIILSGKLYAGTIWKLRDMAQGVRGAFLDIKTEFPLIFHATDPSDDLMIMCKLADKINIPDQQTTKNEFSRDFQIPLRASNPRFLSVLRQNQSLTGIVALIDFTTTDYMIVEDFWQPSPTGLSTGYVQKGEAIQRGSGFLTLPAYKRNWVGNPRGQGGTQGVFSPTGQTVTSVPGSSPHTFGPGVPGTLLKLTLNAADPVNTPGMIVWSPFHTPSGGSPYLGPPMVVGGERLRLTGYWSHSGMSSYGSARARTGYRVVDATGAVKTTVYLDPYLFNNSTGVPESAGGTGYWKLIDRSFTIPANTSGWVQPFIEFTNPTTQWNGSAASRELLFTSIMIDLDDGTTLPEFVDASMPGAIAEGVLHTSPSRRIWPIANHSVNPTGTKFEPDGSPTQTTWGISSSQFGESTTSVVAGQVNPAVGGDTAFKVVAAQTGGKTKTGVSFQRYTAYDNTPVTFSLYAKKENPATPARMVELDIRWYDASDVLVSSSPVAIAVDSDVWTRYYYTIVPPAGALTGFPYLHWLDALVGESHLFGWVMIHEGSYPKKFARIAGTDGSDTSLISGPSSVGNYGIAATVGPIAQINYATDPDINTGIAPDLLNCTQTVMPTGGALDKGSYARLAYSGGGKTDFGIKRSAGFGNAVGQDWWTASVQMRSGSSDRQLSGRLRFEWLDSAGALISSNITPVTMLGTGWTEIKIPGVQAPGTAVELKLYAMVDAPVTGDLLDVDKIVITNGMTTGEYFDGSSEWSEWIGVADTSKSRRFLYQNLQTSRKFHEGQQTVKFKTYPTLPSVLWNDIHLALAYFDPDNELYTGFQGGRLGIWKREDGVLTQIALAGAFAALTANTTYWVRGRISKGIVFSEFYTSDPTVADAPLPVQKVQYTMTAVERAKWQDDNLHYMTMGLQERGAKWSIDEWHVRDVAQPEGWNWHRGAGTVISNNNALRPLDSTEKVFTRSGLPYKVADAKISAKLRYNRQPTMAEDSLLAGVVAKFIDKNNFIAATLTGKNAGGAGIISMNLVEYVNGVASTMAVSEIGTFPPNVNTWVRLITSGDTITAERWGTDPALGGAPNYSIEAAMTPARIARWGAGVKGEFGIYWLPTVLDSTIDDFRFDTPTFDDIAYTVYNKGNFEAQTTIELTGPMANPRVTNEANNTSFKINGTIPVGETWVLENSGGTKRMYRKSDGANRFQYLDQTSMWIMLEPNNIANNIRFIASALAAGWDLKVAYRHTYM